MLQKNPLSPPRPPRSRPAVERRTVTERTGTAFVSAEDFDGTGILAGVDPCESRYWWMPELASAGTEPRRVGQATSSDRSAAAATA